MSFQWPSGWIPTTREPERRSAYKPTAHGNLEIAVELTSAIRGARGSVPWVEEAPPPPELPEEFGTLRVPSRAPIRREEPPLTELGMQPVRERPTRPVRPEFGVALLPEAGVRAFKEYLRRLPPARVNLRSLIWGAAWAIFTSEIQAAPFGYFVQAAQHGLVYTSPETRVLQRAFRPKEVPDTVLSDTRGGRTIPVAYYTVLSAIHYVTGRRFTDPDFLHAMTKLPWRICGRIPRTGSNVYCPTRAPTAREREEMRPTGQVPLPTAEDLGEAQPLAPRQRVLE